LKGDDGYISFTSAADEGTNLSIYMNRKVLLIEDNLEVRENTLEMLELAGYQVVAATNGKGGLSLLGEYRPHVILCDIQMSEIDGYEVFRQVKANQITSAIPFIFVTAFTEKKDIQTAINMGANGYLCKPYDADELLSVINQVFEKLAIQ
jgi:CheY-like chemotaxis protein